MSGHNHIRSPAFKALCQQCAKKKKKRTPCSCFIPDSQDSLFSSSFTMLFIGTGTHHENHKGSNGNLT